jgi:hypothetical protein
MLPLEPHQEDGGSHTRGLVMATGPFREPVLARIPFSRGLFNHVAYEARSILAASFIRVASCRDRADRALYLAGAMITP